ncbi:amidohydrolase [Roseateles saccharophilus]|uniref:Carboxypeptidase Ss1 n=1 Tax=Roseateles saccharophilus TaxID=304 RepID=A0A4R3V5M9_ROSSA|nr:amidohydrolase [Roseateles saccharophilus]MDG0834658.1 amidohydrolase [Roseateles saccharophilus]TCU98892.1 carboxypeptidase Ss1 [Roseateles saccharophilus]
MTAADPLPDRIAARVAELEAQVIAWRRGLHQHPELGNREFRTAALVAEHLRALGFDEVKTGVAHTGVVGLLKGGRPGGVVALRADMDGLPVSEEVDLPFASKARAVWNGEEVGVMHACGHDCHVAILMGVASVLAGLRADISGSVKFIFQPAEEMPPEGEEGGAELMIKEGALQNPTPGAIFGLHVTSRLPAGVIGYRPGPTMASSDKLRITVHGRQTHGAAPWLGVDPIVTSAQIVLGLQTIVSRNLDLNREPAVVTIGAIKGGVRENIIPDSVEMRGTIRSFDEGMRDAIHERVTELAEGISGAARASCRVCITKNYPVTVNDPVLTEQMVPTLTRVASTGPRPMGIEVVPKVTGAEDFSFFQRLIPGLFFFVGVTPPDVDPAQADSNHSPRFFADERGLEVGVRALANLAVDYLASLQG